MRAGFAVVSVVAPVAVFALAASIGGCSGTGGSASPTAMATPATATLSTRPTAPAAAPESVPTSPAEPGTTPPTLPKPPRAAVAPPLTDPVIEVLQPGLAEFVPIEGEQDWAERQQTGVIRPEFVNEPKDISFLFTPPEQWVIDESAGLCGWAASTAFADQCISLGAFQPGLPWGFPASSVGDDVFELWLTGWEWGRRLIVIDATKLEPGSYTIALRDPNASIDDIITTPPGDDGNYAVLR